MLRALNALREWLRVRARVREEREFHLERAIADLRELGLSLSEAKKKARARFGERGTWGRLALRELGGDLSGLRSLMQGHRRHRVLTSAWLQPSVLLAAIAAIFALSPGPREIADGMLVRLRTVTTPGAVVFSVDGRSPWSGGAITAEEFDGLRSMATVTEVGKYRGLYARARAVRGARLEAMEAEARAKTGNAHFVVRPMAEKTDVAMGPAQMVWLVLAVFGAWRLYGYARQMNSAAWLAYGIAVGGLNAAASMAAFAWGLQVWSRAFGRAAGAGFAMLFATFLIAATMQCRWWWMDLRRRCPVCLTRMVLPLTEGGADRVLLNPAVTESVCQHGHGVLVESRWVRRFRAEESPLEGLLHV